KSRRAGSPRASVRRSRGLDPHRLSFARSSLLGRLLRWRLLGGRLGLDLGLRRLGSGGLLQRLGRLGFGRSLLDWTFGRLVLDQIVLGCSLGLALRRRLL